MKKQNIILFGMITFMLFSMMLVSAETEGYPINKNIDLKFTCTINGAIPSALAKYNITINYPNGSTYLEEQVATPRGNGAFNYTTNFSELGLYKIQMFCWDGSNSFADEGYYKITTTGQTVSLSNIVLVIAFLIVGIILFVLGYTFEKEKWILKTTFYIFSLLMCLLAINSGSIIASESLGLSKMSMAGLVLIISVILVMILYLFIVWTIQTFKQVKNKESVRWNY